MAGAEGATKGKLMRGLWLALSSEQLSALWVCSQASSGAR